MRTRTMLPVKPGRKQHSFFGEELCEYTKYISGWNWIHEELGHSIKLQKNICKLHVRVPLNVSMNFTFMIDSHWIK